LTLFALNNAINRLGVHGVSRTGVRRFRFLPRPGFDCDPDSDFESDGAEEKPSLYIQTAMPRAWPRAPFATFHFPKKPLADRAVYPIHSGEIDLSKRRGVIDSDSDPDPDSDDKI